MPDDVGGRPFPDGREPDDDRGGADDEFASVVFDEAFVRAAKVHEPTAVERLVAAAQARADAAGSRGGPPGDDAHTPDARAGHDDRDDDPDGLHDPYGPYGPYGGALRPYRPGTRWYRPVAWLVALLMGLGMVALALTSVHRGSSGGREEKAPTPASSGVGPDGTPPAGRSAPPVPAAPGTP
ncbi:MULTISPECIES: hypothetical protein [Streptomyces]|uniref:Uncharacterized protein n=1 Tax=Streptomyces sudanensis TaxID=436397 RepID=A0ABY4TAQ0_9ACTN|nr:MULTISPECIES: hypothetical protein [Streptomyces]MCQ0000474.1 hypothetical protein [Streptomyces sudanensis]URN16041.1 hypothetical protein MW084_08855 [Streptomyces sudanensis]